MPIPSKQQPLVELSLVLNPLEYTSTLMNDRSSTCLVELKSYLGSQSTPLRSSFLKAKHWPNIFCNFLAVCPQKMVWNQREWTFFLPWNIICCRRICFSAEPITEVQWDNIGWVVSYTNLSCSFLWFPQFPTNSFPVFSPFLIYLKQRLE